MTEPGTLQRLKPIIDDMQAASDAIDESSGGYDYKPRNGWWREMTGPNKPCRTHPTPVPWCQFCRDAAKKR